MKIARILLTILVGLIFLALTYIRSIVTNSLMVTMIVAAVSVLGAIFCYIEMEEDDM